MILDSVFIEGSMNKIASLSCVIVGGGISAYSCAVDLYDRGITDIAILTDSKEGATSLYAQSDHQAYYRLAGVGNDSDSPYRMARTLISSGNMDGDNALVEATLSSRCFFRLLELGLPFEQDEYGAFVSRGVASDKTRRMVSAGTDTAHRILAALEFQVKERAIPIFENHQVIRILTDDDKKRAVGVLAINKNGLRERHQRFLLINAKNVVLATGGPGGLYFHEGYPKTHYGCLGTALRAGVKAQNMGEFTVGICAVRRSLMMNGAYQAALPRYVSTDDTGKDVQEFLLPYFDSPEKLYALQKRKAEQWEFDVKKARSDGSSLIDLLVYYEIVYRKRHVFMDFRDNPKELPVGELDGGTKPFERLRSMSPEAYTALLDQELDPAENPVEVYPSVIHHNGGLAVDTHYKSSMDHLYVVGEAAGSHGSLVPPGASINQTQVSALRVAEAISKDEKTGKNKSLPVDVFVSFARKVLRECVGIADSFLASLEQDDVKDGGENLNIRAARIMIGKHMDRVASIYLDPAAILEELDKARTTLDRMGQIFKPSSQVDLCQYFEIEDLLLTQIAVLASMLDETKVASGSRGNHLQYDAKGTIPSPLLPEIFRFSVSERETGGKIQELLYDTISGSLRLYWREARPIPKV